MAARIVVGNRGWNEVPYADGVLTQIGTFQKFFTQAELRAYLEEVLGLEVIPAALGVFHAFKDEELRQAFIARRYRRRSAAPRKRISVIRFEGNREILEPLIDWVADRGRLPEEMRSSFRDWVRSTLDSAGLYDGSERDLKDFDRLLKPLLEQGRADLFQIGCWLAGLDFNSAASVQDALRIILDSCDTFGLPRFTRFPFARRSVTLANYIERAHAFFSYSQFLEAREQNKAETAIRQILETLGDGGETSLPLDDEDVIGPYGDSREFLEGLRNYILTEDHADREKLRRCDFVTITDGVLKYRKRTDRKAPTETRRRLSGSPVEVVLHALWQTLREFGKNADFRNAEIERIEISSDRFKHDYEHPEDDDDTTYDQTESARQYLLRLVGGVDQLVASRIEISRDGGDNIPIVCQLTKDEVPCVYSKTAEPQLEFSIHVMHDVAEKPACRKFAWRLPEIQPYRLAEALIASAQDTLRRSNDDWNLPVFHLPYYEELLRSTDEEDVRRVLLHSVRDEERDAPKWTNLLGREWLDIQDPLRSHLEKLADAYFHFVSAASDSGLHVALFSDKWTELRKAYSRACLALVECEDADETQMGPMLMRCFLVVEQRKEQEGKAWCTDRYERSGIATVLHPAVLEMLEAQIVYLFSCFNHAVEKERKREERRKAFEEKNWNAYVDLASIRCPIAGLLFNADCNLDTDIRGQDLIHRVGSPVDNEATLSTRLLLRYENANDDETVADPEMFRESRDSKLLFRLLTDYFRLHPHACDGLTLAVFRNEDIQPVIAAVHQFLKKLSDPKDPRYFVLRPERRKPYAISVTVFSESGDDVDVIRWIDQWRERWEASETETKFDFYRRCKFSVSHRLVETNRLGAFQRLINESLQTDIAVLYNFIRGGKSGNVYAEVNPFDVTARLQKFPILEKTCCSIRHPIDNYKRSRVISNHQFALGKLHTQVMHRLKNQGVQAGKEFVILGVGDFSPWRGVVDALHAKAEWVICIDPSMDERLIRVPAGEKMLEREIISFGSGVGCHGEANYTISTEQYSLTDVRNQLAISIQGLYSECSWSVEACQKMADSVLREVRELSGLSLVRATGGGHYVRDFLAYALTRKMLREQRQVLCDHLISLDAYRHWFDFAEIERRPDLMWLTAYLNDRGLISVEVRLIECKLGLESDGHLIKARAQIKNGLDVLRPAFKPRPDEDCEESENVRPDHRYWWLQLHRLIASKAEISNNPRTGEKRNLLSALEQLAEGEYEISWNAAVFAFWSDDKSAVPRRIGYWDPSGEGNLTANIYAIGSEFVKRLALGESNCPVSWEGWEALTTSEEGNVCDELEDIELPLSEEDEEDIPAWETENGDEEKDDAGEDAPEIRDDGYAEPTAGEPPTEDFSIQPLVPPDSPQKELEDPSVPGIPNADGEAGVEGERPVIEVCRNIPERVLLGTTVRGNRSVFWEFGHSELANRHMLIFGTSGMGKTYAIQCFLGELARQGQNSLITDYTDGFIPSKLEAPTAATLDPLQHFIQQAPLPINPFKAQISYEAGMEFSDSAITIAKRVAAIFKSVYELGNQQFPVLIDAITEGIETYGDEFNLTRLLAILQDYIEDKTHATSTVRTTTSKLKPFIQSNPFAADAHGIGWEDIFSDTIHRCHVFQFFKVDKHSARALVEFVLWDLYSFVSNRGDKNTPRIVVLDEVQNLDLGPDAPVAKYLTEGRKHGLALITATQTVKGVGGVNDARVSRLFQAEQKLFFKPTENEMREHAQLLHNAISTVSVAEWSTRLASLQKGECWSLGRSLVEDTGDLAFKAQRIKISSLEERGF